MSVKMFRPQICGNILQNQNFQGKIASHKYYINYNTIKKVKNKANNISHNDIIMDYVISQYRNTNDKKYKIQYILDPNKVGKIE